MTKKETGKSFGLSGRSDHVRAIVYVSWVIAFGSTDAALFMFMLSRWYDKGSRADGYIYKSSADIEAETGLKRGVQERIRKSLEAMGAISMILEPVNKHPTLHYRLNRVAAQKLINDAEKSLDSVV